jgi:hypothetical protein
MIMMGKRWVTKHEMAMTASAAQPKEEPTLLWGGDSSSINLKKNVFEIDGFLQVSNQ